MTRKRRVTFHRMITGVEDVTIMMDADIDLNTLTEDKAYDMVEDALACNTAMVDTVVTECEYPHSVSAKVNGKIDEYIDFSKYAKENG